MESVFEMILLVMLVAACSVHRIRDEQDKQDSARVESPNMIDDNGSCAESELQEKAQELR